MSYLSGLLSSIGDDGPAPAPASASAPASARPTPPVAAKRKADSELNNGPAKRPTPPSKPLNPLNGAPKRPATPSNVTNGTATMPKSAAPPTEHQGAARAGVKPVIKKEAKPQASPAVPLSVKVNSKPASSPTKPATPIADKPPPKKGSYADILARAKANQQTKPPAGIITHKQGEKIDRKALAKEGTKDKNGLLLKDKKAGDRSRTGSTEVSSKAGDNKSKQKPKPVEKSDYKGSARPTTPVYTGSARPGQQKKPPPRRNDGYVGTDEEMDDIDDEEDYYSDESDMEAGAFDVEREEQEALRQAKRDDAMELALENRLKAEKNAKRQQLAQIAAARAKKREGGY